jgi:type II secretion system protein C
MKKSIPAWAITTLWCLSIAVSALLTSQLASLYLQKILASPRKIVIAKKDVQEQEDKRKPLQYYRSSIVPIFGDRKIQPEKAPTPANTGNPQETEESGNPADQVPWDRYLVQHNPKNINLKGTVIGDEMSIALLQVDGKDLTLHLGQKTGNFYLNSVSNTSITFSNGRDTRIVAMSIDPDSALGEVPMPVPETVPTPPVDEVTSSELDGIISYQGDKRIVDRRKFDDLLKPPSRLAHEVKFLPNSKDGQPYGIKISYLKPDSFFSRAGLRSGDVLIRTNDKVLQTVEDSFYAYQAFKNEDHLIMEVDRDGEIIHIPMEFR